MPKFMLSPYIFGIQTLPLLASGLYSLLWPSAAAEHQKTLFQGVSNGTIQAMSLTSLALGTCHAIAVYQKNIPIMIGTIPGRLVAAFVFWRGGEGWKTVAPFEGTMALVTAMAVYWDLRSGGI